MADLAKLGQASGVADIGLQDVDDLGFEDFAHFPDGAVALARGQGHWYRFPHPAHDLDVAGHPGLFEKQQVVGFELRRKLFDEWRRHLGVGVKHDGAIGTHFLAGLVHGGDAWFNLSRRPGVVLRAPGADLDPLR